MEIERKYLLDQIPFNLSEYPSRKIEQGYLCTEPVVRIRRDGEDYYLTYKSKGLMVREEYNLPLTRDAYEHLKPKADGRIITKERFLIPLDDTLTIELDRFEDSANAFVPPDWFGEDVTFSSKYHNSTLSRI